MASRRILELWTLATAAKSITKHHLRIRTKQLKAYGININSLPTAAEKVKDLLEESKYETEAAKLEPEKTTPEPEPFQKGRIRAEKTAYYKAEKQQRLELAEKAAGLYASVEPIVKEEKEERKKDELLARLGILKEEPPVPSPPTAKRRIWNTVHVRARQHSKKGKNWDKYYTPETNVEEQTPVEEGISLPDLSFVRSTKEGSEQAVKVPEVVFDTVKATVPQPASTDIPQQSEDRVDANDTEREPIPADAILKMVKTKEVQQSTQTNAPTDSDVVFDTVKASEKLQPAASINQTTEDNVEAQVTNAPVESKDVFNTKTETSQATTNSIPQKPEDVVTKSDLNATTKPTQEELARIETALGSIGAREQDMEEIEEQELHTHLPHKRRQLQESKVPTSRLSRIFHYGGLATSLAFGASTEWIRRVGSNDKSGSVLLSEANIERLVNKLTKMRGAALKLGQMLSIQDSKLLPPAMQEVLTRVQDSANYMPASQRDQVLVENLGPNWRKLFSEFEEIPMAAASIGQVHAAKLASTGLDVVVKVQYPGVAESIDSDLSNIAMLLMASKMLPKGLYLDKTIANARVELGWECDYIREAECARRFSDLLEEEGDVYGVPRIINEASGKTVLTMERMWGTAVTRMIDRLTQEQRDYIGTHILRLCLLEVCDFAFMQTDPNWTNFLWNEKTNKIELLDFGASREFPPHFIRLYVGVLCAAARGDRKACKDLSIELGYLTGYESEAMTEAHINSIVTLAEPYRHNAPEVYDFSNQTITERVKELIPLMLKERLAPPPEETYSLHRKMSGAFLLCARLGSRIRCREIFEDAVSRAQSL